MENNNLFFVTNSGINSNTNGLSIANAASMASQLNSINLNDTVQTNTDKTNKLTRVYDFFALLKKYYGLILAILSTICITCSMFLVKMSIVLNASDMSVVIFAVQLVFCIPFGYLFKQNLLGPKKEHFLLIARGLTGVVSILACYFSVKLINFADAISIRSMGFVLTTLMARMFLSEKFTFIHFIAIALSMTGTLCIVRPTFLFKHFGKIWEFEHETSTVIGYSLILFGTLALSSTFIFVKKLTNKNIHFSIIVFYFSLIGFIVSVVISSGLFLAGVAHETWDLGKQFVLRDIALGLLAGLCAMLGHVCFTLAIATETANKIALFRTLDILIAYLLEFFILKTMPQILSLVGSCFILMGVLTIFIYKLMILKRLQQSDSNYIDNHLFRI